MRRLLFGTLLLLPYLVNSQALSNPPAFLVHALTNSGLEKVTVENKRTQETVITNEQGRFVFRGSLLPTDTLLLSAIGYETTRLLPSAALRTNQIAMLAGGSVIAIWATARQMPIIALWRRAIS